MAVLLSQRIWFPESSPQRMDVSLKVILPSSEPRGDCESPQWESVSAQGFPYRNASPVPSLKMIYSRE